MPLTIILWFIMLTVVWFIAQVHGLYLAVSIIGANLKYIIKEQNHLQLLTRSLLCSSHNNMHCSRCAPARAIATLAVHLIMGPLNSQLFGRLFS